MVTLADWVASDERFFPYAESMDAYFSRSLERARRQTELWTDEDARVEVALRMYEIRMVESLPQHDMNSLRGVEGTRMKAVYRRLAKQYGVEWHGRRYDRNNPEKDDAINAAINHASTAVRAAGMIAVSATNTIPQLGFIHEAAGTAFALDIADMYRASFMLPVAFEAVKKHQEQGWETLERVTRRLVGERLRGEKMISEMIDRIKEVLDVDHDSRDA